MDHFNYRDGELFAEDVPVSRIAERLGTPAYIYSRATLERHYRAYDQALGEHPHLVCYAVKANSNLAVLNVLARLGAGFDIVSAGELERVLRAGGDAGKVVFSGVGKQEWEMKRALEVGVRQGDGSLKFDIYCQDREFTAEEYGEQLIPAVAHYIRSLRRSNEPYPIYLTDLHLPHDLEPQQYQRDIQTCQYLHYRSLLEDALNRQLR